MSNKQKIVTVFNGFAQQYQDKFMEFDLYHDTFDMLCSCMQTPHARVLDLACGSGNVSRYLQKNRPDWHFTGLDIADQMIERARANVPEGDFFVMDIRDMLQLNRQFDVVVAGFLLPYLCREELEDLLDNTLKVLKPGGVIYLSTMEDDYAKSGPKAPSTGDGPALNLYYYRGEEICAMLEARGFSIVDNRRKDYDEQTVDFIVIARRK